MKKHKNSKRKKHRSKNKFLILFPIGMLVLGVVLISLAFFDTLKHAYYISQLFITQEVVVDAVDISGDSSLEETDGNNFPEFGEKYAELKIESAGIVSPIYVGDSLSTILVQARFLDMKPCPERGSLSRNNGSSYQSFLFECLDECVVWCRIT